MKFMEKMVIGYVEGTGDRGRRWSYESFWGT